MCLYKKIEIKETNKCNHQFELSSNYVNYVNYLTDLNLQNYLLIYEIVYIKIYFYLYDKI